MNIYLATPNLKTASLCQIYLGKVSLHILMLEIQDYHLIINALLCLAIISMVILLVVMAKSLRTLKESALHNQENGKDWIKEKLFDFDAEQIKILLKKINKADKNDKQVETKN